MKWGVFNQLFHIGKTFLYLWTFLGKDILKCLFQCPNATDSYWHLWFLSSEYLITSALVGFGDRVSEFSARTPSLLNSLLSIYYLPVSFLQLSRQVVRCSTSLFRGSSVISHRHSTDFTCEWIGQRGKLKNSPVDDLGNWCREIKLYFWLAWTVLETIGDDDT